METIENIVREMRDWWMRSDNEEADAELKSFANRIEAAVKVLEADRDNWRRQALDEDARANAINFAANTNADAKVYTKSEMIESVVKAATQAVQLTNEKFARPVGNAAAMREAANSELLNSIKSYQINSSKAQEALQKIVLLTVKAGKSISCDVACGIIAGTAKCALRAPARNCDAFSKDEVLEVLKDRSFSKEDTIEWLFAEARGEAK